MKQKKIIIAETVLIILLIIGCYNLYSEHMRTMDVFNNYESNRFFQALFYFNDLEVILNEGNTAIIETDIDYHISKINNVLQVISELPSHYNRIYSKTEQQPKFLISRLLEIRYKLIANDFKIDDTTINDINTKVKKINTVSMDIYGFNKALTEEEREKINKNGFLKDKRWIRWIKEVDQITSNDDLYDK